MLNVVFLSVSRCQETSDEDSECLSSSTAELVMDNNVTTTCTIKHCSTKGFPSSSPQDLMNNNPSTKHKSFGTSIISTNTNNIQNNELKCSVSSSITTTPNNYDNDNECLESVGSVPDADLTESLATATEVLTEILVKTNIDNRNCNGLMDTNGNDTLLSVPSPPTFSSPLKQQHPNVSSSSTQTECSPSSSYLHVCCCKEWNCWKSAADDKKEKCNSSTTSSVLAYQSTSRCCHHRRKKTNGDTGSCCSSGSETTPDKINSCECTVTTKYSKSWRELRKNTNNKRSSMICRFQSCNRSSKPV